MNMSSNDLEPTVRPPLACNGGFYRALGANFYSIFTAEVFVSLPNNGMWLIRAFKHGHWGGPAIRTCERGQPNVHPFCAGRGPRNAMAGPTALQVESARDIK